jgi:allantoinase
MELAAIELVCRLQARYPSVPMHIVHLSTSSALPLLRRTRALGLPLTVETCFHYLTLTAETVPEGRTTFKCCPPIRSDANRDALWRGLLDGDIDYVISDHSPCTVDLKRLDTDRSFLSAWGGIASLGLGLALVYAEATRRGIALPRVMTWLASRPAAQLGLEGVKGVLAVGADADVVVFDPEAAFVVRSAVRTRVCADAHAGAGRGGRLAVQEQGLALHGHAPARARKEDLPPRRTRLRPRRCDRRREGTEG